MKAWRMASCYYLPAEAEIVVARITSWAAMMDPVSHGPGLGQADATQLAAHLAYLRHVCSFGSQWDQLAWYSRPGNTYLGTLRWGRSPTTREDKYSVPILGEAPFRAPSYNDGNLGDRWPWELALACETVLRKLAAAEQGQTEVPGWGGEFPGGARPIPGAIGIGGLAVIVAGAAVAVVGSFVAWRYFSPEAAIETASIAAAARAYEARLRTMETTGTLLPPSPIETAQADRVKQAAQEAKQRNWMIGAGVAGGLGGGLTLASFLKSRVSA